jgi:hypothetical protein
MRIRHRMEPGFRGTGVETERRILSRSCAITWSWNRKSSERPGCLHKKLRRLPGAPWATQRRSSRLVWGFRWLDTMPQDLSGGLRQSRRNAALPFLPSSF